jgi:hypothetical protein
MLALDRLKRASLQRIRKAGGNNTRLGTEKAQPGQRHDAATARTASMPACRDCEPAANVFLLSPRERERVMGIRCDMACWCLLPDWTSLQRLLVQAGRPRAGAR